MSFLKSKDAVFLFGMSREGRYSVDIFDNDWISGERPILSKQGFRVFAASEDNGSRLCLLKKDGSFRKSRLVCNDIHPIRLFLSRAVRKKYL